MRDPFRPDSSGQLIREAQIAFVVIGALLCVLVYVAFHRISGRKFHFKQIAQKVPVAENVADTPYPAEVLIEKNEKAVQNAFDAISALKATAPQSDATSASTTQKRATPDVMTFEALPVTEISAAAASPVVTIPSVAQANFIDESADKKDADNLPSEEIKPFKPFPPLKPFVPLPKPNKPLPEKAEPIQSLPADQKIPSKKDSGPEDPFSAKSETSETPPEFESNFGGNVASKFGSLEPVANTPKFSTDNIKRRPAADRDDSFKRPLEIKQPEKPKLAKENLVTARPFVHSPKPETPTPIRPDRREQISSELNNYEVQPNDSLWSIATEKYGDGRFFRALHEHNRDRIASIDQLQPHSVIVIPEVAELKKLYPSLCPADQLRSAIDPEDSLTAEYELRERRMNDRYYVTQSGDTLFDVARQRLGQASRYLEIYELNEFRIPEQVNHLTPLKPGLRLLLPE